MNSIRSIKNYKSLIYCKNLLNVDHNLVKKTDIIYIISLKSILTL